MGWIWAAALVPYLLATPMPEPGAAKASIAPSPERIVANDNRSPAGVLADGVLRVSLVADAGLWHPELEHGPGFAIHAFGE
jgi:hypothetical protein